MLFIISHYDDKTVIFLAFTAGEMTSACAIISTILTKYTNVHADRIFTILQARKLIQW